VDFCVICPIASMVSMAYFVTEMYSTRARKVDISVWTIHRWNLRFIGFPKIYSSSRLMLGQRAIGNNVIVDTRKMDVPLHGAAATFSDQLR